MTIRLRSTVEADLDFVLAAETAEDNRRFITQWSREQHRTAFVDPDHQHFILERLGDRYSVGYLIFQGLTDPNLNVQIRRIVVTEKGKGYGRMALQLAKKMAFSTFNTHRLWLDVKTFNPRAQHLYASEGFMVEGTMRECIKVGDRFESLTLMSMLRPEYLALQGASQGASRDVVQ